MMNYIIVQAGGRGFRLQHLTKNKPKALVPVDNLPMLFHLFRMYPDKRFVLIADYKKDVLREYLAAFTEVQYQVVEAEGTGTCAGIRQAVEFLPEKEPFLLIWSDLILPSGFELPEEYRSEALPVNDYIGISGTFLCRWSYQNGVFWEERSDRHGVAGFFLFTDKRKLRDVPDSGEFVRWMQQGHGEYREYGECREYREDREYREISLAGTREFGLLEEYRKLPVQKCRPFNRVTVEDGIFRKEPVDAQGEKLAERECAWYEKAGEGHSAILPRIYGTRPLRMEYIKGRNIYEYDLDYEDKRRILEKLVFALEKLHTSEQVPADSFSMKEAYFNKTMDRLRRIEDLVPYAREREIIVNGRKCRNVYYHKRELEKRLEGLRSCRFSLIHGDCTFSNMMLREDGSPVLIDPRGYFGHTEIYGDARYDWAKMYYSIVGNYDRFNLKDFELDIGENGVHLKISSNHWEDMEQDFFAMTGANEGEIKLLHAVIWLSLTTYAWQDYDSVCGAFYNGLYYLEEIL